MIERLVAKRGGRIVSAAGEGTETDDPANELFRRIIDSFAAYERALIAARTRAALAAKRQRNERTSRFAPFGYRIATDGRTLVREETEQEILGVIGRRRAKGESLRAIAAYLNAIGSRTRAGSLWRFEYVRSVAGRMRGETAA
jgi:DNA invertase Pin-like site-specific DNA recombinase